MRKLLLVLFIIWINIVNAQVANFSKVTCPVYKVPNSTVAPLPSSTGFLYALSNHLYWGTTQLDVGAVSYTATPPMSLIGNDIHILPDTLTAWWTKQNQGAVAYSWGNHGLAGYEIITNKQNSTSTSIVKYPTWNAAKAYVDSVKATVASSQWTTEPDGIYYGGKVGIGVTNVSSTDSTLQGVSASFTRGVEVGYDMKVNGKTIGKGKGNIQTNVAFGDITLNKNTTGSLNVGVGFWSLKENTTGYGNTAIGYISQRSATTSILNTSVGSNTLPSSNGKYNSAFGASAMFTNTTGFSNTAVGVSALYSNTTGHNNIAIGDSAGYSYTTLSNRMYLGARDSTTTGIFFNRTTGINKGYWNGAIDIKGKIIAKTMPVIAGNADTAVVWNANDSSFARQAIGDCPVYEEGVRTQEFTATAGQTNFVVTLFTANSYYVPMIDYCPQSHLIVTRTDNTFTYSPGLKAGQKLIIMN